MPATPADLNAVLEAVRAKHGVVALAAAVIRDGRIIAEGAVGERKRGSGVKVTTRDKWHLGSCTKAMTATLIARLVERKALSWTSSISAVLGWEDILPVYREVTLQDLLRHRGGIIAATDDEVANNIILLGLARAAGPDAVAQMRAVSRGALSATPEVARGTYHYSNAGYVIAAVMAERATGRPWTELIETEVFRPLGITTFGFGAAGTPGKIDQPMPHLTRPGGTVPVELGEAADNPPANNPAGRVHMSLADWAKFVSAHIAGENGGATDYLSTGTWKKLHEPIHVESESYGYAMGWLVVERPWAGGTAIHHGGSNNMNFCVMWAAPRKGFGMLVACNQGGDVAFKACDEAAGAVSPAAITDP